MNIVYAFFDTFGVIDATTQGGPAASTQILVYKVYHDGVKAARPRQLLGAVGDPHVHRDRAHGGAVPLRREEGAVLTHGREPPRSCALLPAPVLILGVIMVAFPLYVTFVASTLTLRRDRHGADAAAARRPVLRELLAGAHGGLDQGLLGAGLDDAGEQPRHGDGRGDRQDLDLDHLGVRDRLFPLPAAQFLLLDDLRHADAADRGAHHPDLQGRLRPGPARLLRRASRCRSSPRRPRRSSSASSS